MVLYRFTCSPPAKNVPSCAATPLCSANISDFRTRPNITELYCTTAIRFKYAFYILVFFYIQSLPVAHYGRNMQRVLNPLINYAVAVGVIPRSFILSSGSLNLSNRYATVIFQNRTCLINVDLLVTDRYSTHGLVYLA